MLLVKNGMKIVPASNFTFSHRLIPFMCSYKRCNKKPLKLTTWFFSCFNLTVRLLINRFCSFTLISVRFKSLPCLFILNDCLIHLFNYCTSLMIIYTKKFLVCLFVSPKTGVLKKNKKNPSLDISIIILFAFFIFRSFFVFSRKTKRVYLIALTS